MRASLIAAGLLLSFASSAFALHPFASTMTIDTVDPGSVTAGQKTILLLTGKHLNKPGLKCDLTAVQGGATADCITVYIKGSGQLQVTVTPPTIPAETDFLLRLCSTDCGGGGDGDSGRAGSADASSGGNGGRRKESDPGDGNALHGLPECERNAFAGSACARECKHHEC
jgi:hypothetical protein